MPPQLKGASPLSWGVAPSSQSWPRSDRNFGRWLSVVQAKPSAVSREVAEEVARQKKMTSSFEHAVEEQAQSRELGDASDKDTKQDIQDLFLNSDAKPKQSKGALSVATKRAMAMQKQMTAATKTSVASKPAKAVSIQSAFKTAEESPEPKPVVSKRLSKKIAVQSHLAESFLAKTRVKLLERADAATQEDKGTGNAVWAKANQDKTADHRAGQHTELGESQSSGLSQTDRLAQETQRKYAEALTARMKAREVAQKKKATHNGVAATLAAHTSPEDDKDFDDAMTRQERAKQLKMEEHRAIVKEHKQEFELQRSRQEAMLNQMLSSQRAHDADAAKPDGHDASQIKDMFRAQKPELVAEHNKRLHYQKVAKRVKPVDKSTILDDHSDNVDDSMEMVAPPEDHRPLKLKQAEPEKQVISLAQEASGQEESAAASVKAKFKKQMKKHFAKLLAKNKAGFQQMMSKHGVAGAAKFYKNMKQELHAMLQPDSDALLQTGAGPAEQLGAAKKLEGVETKAKKEAKAAKPSKHAEAAKKPGGVETKAKKEAKAAKPKSKSEAKKNSSKKSRQAPAGTMSLAALEEAVDTLSSQEKRKFIMHRLKKLASSL